MQFYTNFYLHGNTLKYREINNGVRSKGTCKLKPTLYTVQNPEYQSEIPVSPYVTLQGDNLIATTLDSVKEARNFINSRNNVYGFDRFAYTKIDEMYPGLIEFDSTMISTLYIDIETMCEESFPDIETADQPINAITMGFKGKTYSFGYDEYHGTKANYKKFDSEESMLSAFIKLFAHFAPDIITGWNIDGFDLPYIYQRIVVVLGEDAVNALSVWGNVYRRKTVKKGREKWVVKISGCSVIDYIDIYKKFKGKMQESYRLDYIAYVELGENKLDYSEYDTLHELYKNDFTKFLDYNVKDVTLVMALETKLSYIMLCTILAYMAKVNYEDVYSNVRMWDVIIANYLRERNIQVHCMNRDESESDDSDDDDQYEGAFVKDPLVGFYKWVVSFDLTSLYPSLIRTYNISPEAEKDYNIVDVLELPVNEINADVVVDRDDVMAKIKPYLKENNLAMAANGTLYDRSKKTFLADLMGRFFDFRKTSKKEMLSYDREIEAIEEELNKRGVY